jgi:uncharacterized membrane protein YjjP (DUF1212 family)
MTDSLGEPAGEPARPLRADELPDNVRELRPRGRFGQWPAAVVLGLIAIAFAIVAADHFRRGAVLFSAAVVLAFFLRLMLPSRDAGLLAVRSRTVDLVVLGVLGLALASLTFLVPAPS